MIALLCGVALAGDDAPLQAEVHGHVKSFTVATFPYDWALLPPDPYGQGTLNNRLMLSASYDDRLRFELHHATNVVSTSVPASSGLGGFSTGVGLVAPEAVDLSWELDDTGPLLDVIGRVDRLVLGWSGRGVDVEVGRQAVTFGTGTVFTPMDIVNPFSAATIDQEYKPGVDAVRVDGYVGVGGQITGVAAYAGDWSLDGTVLAVNGRATVGVTDLVGLVAVAYGEPVVGVGAVSGVGPVGVHGDVTLTAPPDDEVFVRAVIGADWRPTATTSMSGEAYVQTFGADDPGGYLAVARSDRFARGEIWQLGRTYAAVFGSQEITPLVTASLALIGNLEDPSALLAPTMSWSVAANADLGLGAYLGLGERPGQVDLARFAVDGDARVRSEFGLTPMVGFASMRAYF